MFLRNIQKVNRILILNLFIISLVACGHDDDDPVVVDVSLKSPSEPRNINAVVVNETTINLTWEAPLKGGNEIYYQIDKSIDNKTSFTSLDTNRTVTNYKDISATLDVKHIYKITAGNSIGLSTTPGYSPGVTPTTGGNVAIAPDQILLSQSAATDNMFGSALSFSQNGNILAIGEPGGDPVSTVDAGTVQLFNKDTTGWTLITTLNSNAPSLNSGFGTSVGLHQNDMVAVSEPNLSPGRVHIFMKKANGWVIDDTLMSNNPLPTDQFGNSMDFSPDGTTLAVGNSKSEVQLYTVNAGKWVPGTIITLANPTSNSTLGNVILFSPDSKTLAVAESSGDSLTTANIGAVHIISKTASGWSINKRLVSSSTETGNEFGISISFSPDSQTIAIGELSGDLTNNKDVGTVHLFIRNGVNWSRGDVLNAVVPTKNGFFGSAVSFSADGNILAVGESLGSNNGKVQLFIKSGSTWNPGKLLVSTQTTQTGSSMYSDKVTFSPDGATLAVGEYMGNANTVSRAGIVNIYDVVNIK